MTVTTASSIRARNHTDPVFTNGEGAEVFNNTSGVDFGSVERDSITPIQPGKPEPVEDVEQIRHEAEADGGEEPGTGEDRQETNDGDDTPAQVTLADGSPAPAGEDGIPVLTAADEQEPGSVPEPAPADEDQVPEVTPEPVEEKAPSRGGSRAAWVAYAETQGFDPENLTRDEIADHFLGTK